MKLLPDLFNDSFDELFNDSFYSRNTDAMKTDIHETEDSYVLSMELPGYKKEDIQMELKNGYLNIQATKNDQQEEKDEKGNILRQERFRGTSSRSFYLGDGIKEEDIKAQLDNGELIVTFPKKEQKEIEESRFISIE